MSFDLKVAYCVIQRADCPNQFGNNDYIIFFVLCLIKKFAFRAYRGPGDERDVMSPLRQKFAGNYSIFLRPAEYQPCYYVNDFHQVFPKFIRARDTFLFLNIF